jgi:hypothetical protein
MSVQDQIGLASTEKFYQTVLMKKKDISDNFANPKCRWWLDGSNYAFVAVVIVMFALLAVVLAVQSLIPYFLQSLSDSEQFGYWTCYWFTGAVNMFVLSCWLLLWLLRPLLNKAFHCSLRCDERN